MKKEKIKKRVYEIIQDGNNTDWICTAFEIVIVAAILLNIAAAVAETFEELERYRMVCYGIELVTVLLFTVEYILRLWTAEYRFPRRTRWRSVKAYVFSFNGIVELMSFLPFYLPLIFPEGVVAFRMFRVVRILKLFRISKYYDAFNVIGRVLQRKKSQLFSSVFIILVMMVGASLCMYNLEHEAQPEVFKNAFSGFWWSVSTLLTVGYGDIYPITAAGRIMGIIITFLGVGMVAIPTGILSAGFVEQMSEVQRCGESRGKREEKEYCPYCGKKLN